MKMLLESHFLDIPRLWIYCISGLVTVVSLMFMVCYYAFRQEWSERITRKKAKALHYARLRECQQQVDSYPNLTHRPTSDILAELSIGQNKPQTQPQSTPQQV